MIHNSAEDYVYANKWASGRLTPNHTLSDETDRVFLVPSGQANVESSLRRWYPHARVCVLGHERPDFVVLARAKRFALVSMTPWTSDVDEGTILAVFDALKALSLAPAVSLDILTVCAVSSPAIQSVTYPMDSIYLGLGQTLAHEFPDWRVRCFSLSVFSQDAVTSALKGSFPVADGAVIGLDETHYWHPSLEPELLRPAPGNPGFKRGGTYLILGATGGIGGAFARYLARQYGARLILTGRRPEAGALVDEVEQLGGAAIYEALELADPAAVRSLLDRHAILDGVIHSALVLEDASMLRMTQGQLLDVLRPKLHGCINLAKALGRRELDFVLMFSSIQSYIANPGQANYTAACQAQDAVGALMRDVFMTNVKVVNWAFWGSIGVVASKAYRERMRKLEIGSIEIDEGVAIVESLLASSSDQITVIKASDRALHELRILPRTATGPIHSGSKTDFTHLADVTSSVQPDHILPPFQAEHLQVQKNKAASDALQRHARSRLHEVGVPALMPERFEKLATALRRIPPSTGPSREVLLRDFPEMAGHVALLDACVDNYGAIFSEKVNPLAVMFPEGSFKLVEPVYRNNPIADYFNNVMAQTVSAFVRRRVGAPVHILEVGAGTGSTAEFILPAIASARVAYTFTDLSVAFLNNARRRFQDYPFVDYRILNIERPPADAGTYDVIVATNVIHATADIGRTLANLRSMMAPSGVLILNEITACQDFATMTFGLTEGWWLSSDRSRIPDSPLLTGESWRSLLLEAGFAATGHHGSEDQQVIVASTSPPEEVPIARRSSDPAAAGTPTISDPHERAEEYVRRVIGEVLLCDVEEVDVHQPFSELGIDSLIAMELLEPFRRDFGYVPATVLFEHPTVAKFAAYLIESFGEAVPSVVGLPEVRSSTPLQENTAEPDASLVHSLAELHERAEEYVRRVIGAVLLCDVEEIDVHQPFSELGIDSLIAMELLEPFRRDFGYVPATVLFEHPTVAKFAAYLIESFGEAVPSVVGLPEVRSSKPLQENTAEPDASLVDSAAVLPSTFARETLHRIIAQTMMMDAADLDDDTPFMEYGIDSIISMELIAPLREIWGYLPATLLFEHPSIRQLADYLDAAHAPRVPSEVDAEPATIEKTPHWKSPPSDAKAIAISDRLAPRADDIAIIGMAGQFPASPDVDSFWSNLLAGRDCTSSGLAERWSVPTAGEGPYATRAGLIDDVDAFDNAFFGITPLEAARMDPQERLFLQIAHQSVNDAGFSRQALRGTETGVFVGVMNGGYAWFGVNEEAQAPTSLFWSIANRVSYLFDLKGPSMAVDTACSSSLTALHLACQALRSGDCDAALVGGVNLIVHPRQIELLCNMHMLSPTDRCRPFGEGADGFVDGEGVCCLVAKRYADAVTAGDRIFGVVRGTAVNAGGQSNGYSAPNPEAQSRVIGTALSRAGLLPTDLDFVEAHGTGTELGDPIEVRGLTAALAGSPAQTIALGSVKGNIGHLESAAGTAGMVKALLQLHHGTLVPTLNAKNENAYLQLERTPFRLQRSVERLRMRRAAVGSVSSFGAGGANAHAVVQSVERADVAAPSVGTPQIALLSARTESSLQAQIDAFRTWLADADACAEAISYTSCCARDHYRHRVGYVFERRADLLAALEADLQEIKSRRLETVDPATVAALVRKRSAGGLSVAEAQRLVDAHVQGADVPWQDVFLDRHVTSHPRYVFDKTRFWATAPAARLLDRNALVRDHRIAGNEIAPATWALSELLDRTGSSTLRSVTWTSTIGDVTQVRCEEDGERYALVSDVGRRHCEATRSDRRDAFDLNDLGPLPASTHRLDHRAIYDLFEQQGYQYRGDLRRLGWAEIGPSMVKGFVLHGHHWKFGLSPALLDAGLQTAILMPELNGLAKSDEIMVPYHLDEISVLSAPADQAVYSYCRLRHIARDGKRVVYDVYFTDVDRRVLIAMRGLSSVVTSKRLLTPTSTLVASTLGKAVEPRTLVKVYDLA